MAPHILEMNEMISSDQTDDCNSRENRIMISCYDFRLQLSLAMISAFNCPFMSHISCFLANCFAMNMSHFAGVWVPQPAIGCAGYLCSLVSRTCALLVVLFSCPRMHIYSVICWWPGRPLLKLNYTIPTLDVFLWGLAADSCFCCHVSLFFSWGSAGTASTRAPRWPWSPAATVPWRHRWPWTPRWRRPREASPSSCCETGLRRDMLRQRNWQTGWPIRHDQKCWLYMVYHPKLWFTRENWMWMCRNSD